MRRFFVWAVVSGLCLAASGGPALGQDAGARERELAAHFSKEKHKVKERRGVRLEVFLQVRAEPAPRAAAEYSGAYGAEHDYTLELSVAPDGAAEGRGTDPAPGGPRRFTLRDARVTGALLTGTRVYEDGGTERLEGLFLNLTVRHSRTDAGKTSFGLGVVFDPPKPAEGFQYTRLFYAPKR